MADWRAGCGCGEEQLASGATVDMMSMVGRDGEGSFRYYGMVTADASGDKTCEPLSRELS